MFRLTKPTTAEIKRRVEDCLQPDSEPALLNARHGLCTQKVPTGFSHDLLRSEIGRGFSVFQAAIRALEQWRQFELGWVRVANTTASIEVGQSVVVEVHSLCFWSLNLSSIVSVTRDTDAFGFIYRTTPQHIEEGEERFLVTFDPSTEMVHYELEAVSKPRNWVAMLGYPITRAFQHRFARESHKRMQTVVSG